MFLDAEEEVTLRRSTRKRRSTAGSASSSKKPRQGRKMPVERSPGKRSSGTARGGSGRLLGQDGWPPWRHGGKDEKGD